MADERVVIAFNSPLYAGGVGPWGLAVGSAAGVPHPGPIYFINADGSHSQTSDTFAGGQFFEFNQTPGHLGEFDSGPTMLAGSYPLTIGCDAALAGGHTREIVGTATCVISPPP